MTEVFSHNEASAWVWTGDSTTSALFTYVQSQAITFNKQHSSARAPFANQYTYVEIGNLARVNITQMKSQHTAKALILNAAYGALHMKTKSVQPGQGISAGWLLWSGALLAVRDESNAGGIDSMGFDATFQTASAYG